jgi:hypothetical protein
VADDARCDSSGVDGAVRVDHAARRAANVDPAIQRFALVVENGRHADSQTAQNGFLIG